MTDLQPLVVLKLSIQAALLGQIRPNLSSVTCGLRERHIKIRAFLSGTVSEKDVEWIQYLSTDVIADFSDGYTIEETCLSLDHEKEEMLDFWAFRRAP